MVFRDSVEFEISFSDQIFSKKMSKIQNMNFYANEICQLSLILKLFFYIIYIN